MEITVRNKVPAIMFPLGTPQAPSRILAIKLFLLGSPGGNC
jgi:hypothetical protein